MSIGFSGDLDSQIFSEYLMIGACDHFLPSIYSEQTTNLNQWNLAYVSSWVERFVALKFTHRHFLIPWGVIWYHCHGALIYQSQG